MATPSVGSNPAAVENLLVGGGYGAQGLSADKDGNVATDGDVTLARWVGFGTAKAVTVASGQIGPLGSNCIVTSETATADDVHTINVNPGQGTLLLLNAATGHTITLKETGNLDLNGADKVIVGENDCALFIKRTTKWALIAHVGA